MLSLLEASQLKDCVALPDQTLHDTVIEAGEMSQAR